MGLFLAVDAEICLVSSSSRAGGGCLGQQASDPGGLVVSAVLRSTYGNPLLYRALSRRSPSRCLFERTSSGWCSIKRLNAESLLQASDMRSPARRLCSYSKSTGTASYEVSQTFALGSLADKSTDLHAGTRSRQTRQTAAHLQWIARCLSGARRRGRVGARPSAFMLN